jgi:beta-lactam-binding protein with PASTA domain
MDTIFISYRREESAGHAGRIYDRLREKFGKDRVFMDVSAIEPGVDFAEAIDRAVGSCAVLLVVIGRKWLECTDGTGQRRLDDARDFIRLEVATALRLNIRVIPVLVQGAAMPREEDLPDGLKMLARRQAIEINDTHWDSDLSQLVETLERVLSGGVGHDKKGVIDKQPTPEWWKRPRIQLIGSITAVVLVLLGLFAGSDSFRNLFFPETPAVTVPKVIGMTEQDAVDKIRRAGLQAAVELLASPDDRPGTVFHQDPPADSALPAGGRVILHVAKAPLPEPPVTDTKVTVPDVVGQSLDRTKATLREAGLEAGQIEKRVTGEAKAGTVIGQSPQAGTTLSKGKQVRLVVAVGPPEPELVTVPNVVKQPLERAAKMLNDAGLQLGAEDHQPTDKARPGTVLDQKPKGDARVKRGTRVDLLVAAEVQGGPIRVRCVVTPSSIPAGGQAEIKIGAFSGTGSPVTGASVRIMSGGGWFQNSGSTTEVGTTDSKGVFTTRWRAPAPAAAGYGMSVTVTRQGFSEGKNECMVPIQ